MRQFTESERVAMEKAWDKNFKDEPALSFYDSLEAGFAAGLDHAAAQLAALTAERDSLRAEYERLRATCDEVADERLEQATVSNQLRAERDGLRAQIKNIAWAALKYEDATYKVKTYPSNGQYQRQLKKIHDILKAAQSEFGSDSN